MKITQYSMAHFRAMKSGEQMLFNADSSNPASHMALAARRAGGKVEVEQVLLVKSVTNTMQLYLVTCTKVMAKDGRSKEALINE